MYRKHAGGNLIPMRGVGSLWCVRVCASHHVVPEGNSCISVSLLAEVEAIRSKVGFVWIPILVWECAQVIVSDAMKHFQNFKDLIQCTQKWSECWLTASRGSWASTKKGCITTVKSLSLSYFPEFTNSVSFSWYSSLALRVSGIVLSFVGHLHTKLWCVRGRKGKRYM